MIIENLEYQVAFSPDGKTLAAADTLSTLSLWDVVSGRRLRRFFHIRIEHGFAFAPDGKTLFSGGSHFHVWDIARGREVFPVPILGGFKALALRRGRKDDRDGQWKRAPDLGSQHRTPGAPHHDKRFS